MASSNLIYHSLIHLFGSPSDTTSSTQYVREERRSPTPKGLLLSVWKNCQNNHPLVPS